MHRLTSLGSVGITLALVTVAACHSRGGEPVSAVQTTAAEITTTTPARNAAPASPLPNAEAAPVPRALPQSNGATNGTSLTASPGVRDEGSASGLPAASYPPASMSRSDAPLVTPELVQPDLVDPGLENRGTSSIYTPGRLR